MKIKFKELKIDNFLSFEHAELTLNDLGYTIVNGVNENPDDLAKSNGSGKSSLFDAINWCLTGETIRGTKDVVRLNSEGGCKVELKFLVNNDEYVITRSKDPSNLKILVNEQDKSGKGIRDTQKLLEDYLPDLTPSLIGSVIILGQGLPQRFSNNTPSGRKEVLEKLSKSDFMLQDIKDRLSARKLFLSAKTREFEDSVLQLNTQKSVLSKQIEIDKTKLDSMSDVGLKKSIEALTDNKKIYIDKLTEINSKLEQITNERNNINDTLSKLLEKKLKEENDTKSNYSPTLVDLNNDSVAKSTEISSLEKQIKELKNVKDICPTCGQKLPHVHKVDTSNLELKLATLRDDLDKVNIKYLDIRNTLDNALKSITEKYKAEQDKLTADKTENDKSFNSTNKDKEQYDSLLRQAELDITKLNAELNNYNENKQKIEESIKTNQEEILNIDNKILYNNSELDNYKDRSEVNNKMFNLITRDFRGYLLTNVIAFINNKAKEYSKELFETDKVDFILDGNNIDIYYDGKPYECLSGGERQKIDVIVQLSIRDMLCTHLDFSSNILVLDEISDNIDSIGAEKLFNLISNKLTDVESVFIISHHSDYSLPIDNTITVIKGEDKISRIV